MEVSLLLVPVCLLLSALALTGAGSATSYYMPLGFTSARRHARAAIKHRMYEETKEHGDRVTHLENRMLMAILTGEVEAAAKLEEELRRENHRYVRLIARLQTRYEHTDLKF